MQSDRRRNLLVIFLVSMAGLLLEVAYTRIISYKLWYFYTYFVIGLALLGIGSGGILLATIRRISQASTDTILRWSCASAAATMPVGYLIIAKLPIHTNAIWSYEAGPTAGAVFKLATICFVLFASFISIGLVISTILGRAEDGIGRLYFADLVGAGLGCFLAIPFIVNFGPPAVVLIAAAFMALAAVCCTNRGSWHLPTFGALTVVLISVFAVRGVLPDITPEVGKLSAKAAAYSSWGPVFRVDVHEFAGDHHLLAHDATFGSGIWRYNGDPKSQTRFDTDVRRLPFNLLGTPPNRTLIVGSAGGNEILASLRFGSSNIDGVELNPVTVGILRDRYKDFTGNLDTQPGVNIHLGDARTYIARSKDKYDLVWAVAPDSYAANNAASSGAFVLSESYLYTTEMLKRTLEHLSDDGISVAQFGEFRFKDRPNRTARYIVTARAALAELGITDPASHLIVIANDTNSGSLPTIMMKRTPFTQAEVDRLTAAMPSAPVVHKNAGAPDSVEEWAILHAPFQPPVDTITAKLASVSPAELQAVVDSYPFQIDAVYDDKPFFWHFASFKTVLANIATPLDKLPDPENAIGERVLLLLLLISIVYATIFLLLPFLLLRSTWRALPAKRITAVYFGSLGFGFMLFEITMIQRLTRLLGYPSYSLTITLATMLIATGIGALGSQRYGQQRRFMSVVFAVLIGLTTMYEFALDDITNGVQAQSLYIRVLVAVGLLLPLGVCLGAFMPLGLTQLQRIAPGGTYSAWAWAINGFLSVVGSVATTILAMEFGFSTVQWGALAVYLMAVVAYHSLKRRGDGLAVT